MKPLLEALKEQLEFRSKLIIKRDAWKKTTAQWNLWNNSVEQATLFITKIVEAVKETRKLTECNDGLSPEDQEETLRDIPTYEELDALIKGAK